MHNGWQIITVTANNITYYASNAQQATGVSQYGQRTIFIGHQEQFKKFVQFKYVSNFSFTYAFLTCISHTASVTRWYCVETAQPIVKLSSLPGSPMILVF